MVYTVILNPSLEYEFYADEFGSVNEIRNVKITISGKGINVAVVLREFGVPATVLGFVAGFTGSEIERRTREMGIRTDFIRLSHGNSPINVRINDETELIAPCCEVTPEEIMELFAKLNEIKDGDVLLLSGNVPQGCPKDFYAHILECVSAKKIHTVVDAQGELLTETLRYAPDLVKLNLDGLAELFGDKPSTDEEISAYAEQLHTMGAKNVLITMGNRGVLLSTEDGNLFQKDVCRGTVVNSAGAGDSMLAGVVAALIDNDVDFEYALLQGTAAACATVFSDGLGSRDKIIELMKELMLK